MALCQWSVQMLPAVADLEWFPEKQVTKAGPCMEQAGPCVACEPCALFCVLLQLQKSGTVTSYHMNCGD